MTVPDIPYTINGKKVEIAVKKIIHNQSVNNRDSLSNPECLDDCDEELLGEVQFYSFVCESCMEIDVCDELLADSEDIIDCEECGIEFDQFPEIEYEEDPEGFCLFTTDLWDNHLECLINCESDAVDLAWSVSALCEEELSEIDYTLILDNHHNLVSFYSLPEETSISGIMSQLGSNVISVLTEGESAANLDGVWIGSLTEFSIEKGYWISINNIPDNLSIIGLEMNPDRMYEIHEGPNLISFPASGSVELSSAIPDDVEHLFTAIISEGISAMNSDNGWVGSLIGFQGGAGYWVIVEEDLSFSYNTEDLLERSAHSFSEKLPDGVGFNVAQSSRQAFYFVDGIKLNQGGAEVGDWILSYNNDILSGIRQWDGNSIDIPSMGFSGDLVTVGYFNEGDIPTFKLLKQSNGELITLEGKIPNWSDNGIYNIGKLYEKQPIPELFVLNKAYPNPFNPTTTIGFGLPDRSEVVVEIYNLYGKRVEILVNKSMQAGYKSLVWNAENSSSGLYFIKVSASSSSGDKYTSTQKLMLVK